MLRSILITMLLVCVGLSFAQNDVSYYFKRSADQTTNILWFTHFGERVMVDVRYDFDWSNTFAGFVGKTFGSNKLNITPAFGLLRGEYEGISAEAYVGGGVGKLSFFSLYQYTKSTDGKQITDWVYQWVDAYYKLHPFVTVGIGEQIYYEIDGGFNTVDLGPTAKIQVGPVYLKPWFTWSMTENNPNKAFIGVGYNF